MNTETINLTQVNVNAKNPRKISDPQLQRLVKSLLVFPEMLQLRPIVVDETNTALGGNMRYRALTAITTMSADEIRETLETSLDYNKKTEAEKNILLDHWAEWQQNPTAIIVRASQLTEAQKREFIIKDNVAFGDWDDKALTADFDPDELVDWGLGDIDDTPDEEEAEEDDFGDEDAANAATRCNPGDIWMLGRHRLMCGDSTKEEDVARLMGGELADCLVTDPPYNVNYEDIATSHKHKSKTRKDSDIANDNLPQEEFIAFLTAAFNCASEAMRPGAAYYIWHADTKGWEFRTALFNANFQLRQTLMWVKSSLILGRNDYQWKHEPCLYGWKDGAAHYFTEDRTQSTVIEDAAVDYRKLKKDELLQIVLELTSDKIPTTVIYENKPTKNDIHPTMKPVKLMARLIRNSTRPKELVLDLFGGSGSTMIAAEQIDRRCFMMEFDPKYCDAILARWEKLTGEEAEKITP